MLRLMGMMSHSDFVMTLFAELVPPETWVTLYDTYYGRGMRLKSVLAYLAAYLWTWIQFPPKTPM